VADEAAGEGDLGSATLVLSTQDADYNLGIDEAQDRAKAMDKVFEETHEAIKSRFAERFEHAGLFMFSRQVLGLAGLSDVARHTMGVITLGFEEVAGAAGLATSTIAPLLLAAGAGILIFEKLHGSHHKAAESLDELAKKQSEALGTTVDLEQAMEKYQQSVGPLPGSLDKLRDATEKLDESQRRNLITTEALMMKAAQETIAANNARIQSTKDASEALREQMRQMQPWEQGYKSAQDTLKHYDQALRDLDDSNRKAAAGFEQSKADIKAQAEGYKDAKTRLEQLADAHDKAAAAAKKQSAEEVAAAREIMKADDERVNEDVASAKAITAARESLVAKTKILADQAAEATSTASAKRSAEIKKFEDQNRREIEKTYDEAVAKAKETGASLVELERQKNAALTQLHSTVAAKQRENFTAMQSEAIKAADSIETAFGDAFAKTLVEGKDFGEQMQQMFKQVAEMIISDLIKIAIQAEITKEAVASVVVV
jgi:chromosome segregation ATPase